MRKILFRGRKKNGTEWFEGDLSYLVHDKRECYIFPPNGYNSPDCYEVAPATVGQFTGLTDKNGVNIFEGDIIKDVDTGKVFSVEWHVPAFIRVDSRRYFYWDLDLLVESFEVIGNIHDNPELLDRKKENYETN